MNDNKEHFDELDLLMAAYVAGETSADESARVQSSAASDVVARKSLNVFQRLEPQLEARRELVTPLDRFVGVFFGPAVQFSPIERFARAVFHLPYVMTALCVALGLFFLNRTDLIVAFGDRVAQVFGRDDIPASIAAEKMATAVNAAASSPMMLDVGYSIVAAVVLLAALAVTYRAVKG